MSQIKLGQNINVVVYDTPEYGSSRIVYETIFPCNKCKYVRTCTTDDIEKCKFVEYLKQKNPGILCSFKNTKPTVDIILFGPDDAQIAKVKNIVERAKRLRAAGPMKSEFKKTSR